MSSYYGSLKLTKKQVAPVLVDVLPLLAILTKIFVWYLFDFVIFWEGLYNSLIVKFGLRWGVGLNTILILTLQNFWSGDPPFPHITILFQLIINACTNPLYWIQYFIQLETITITKHNSFLTLIWTPYWFLLTGGGRLVDHTPLCETPHELFFVNFLKPS